jgi:hypothetical protein
MSMPRRLNIALVAAAALTVAIWSAPAAANGERPSGAAAVSEKTAGVAVPKKARRAAVRKRVAWAPRVRQPIPRPIPYGWFGPYERVAARWPILMLGIGF